MHVIGARTVGAFGFACFAVLETATPRLVFAAIVLSLIPRDMLYAQHHSGYAIALSIAACAVVSAWRPS